ncbi:hypothetical protein BC827DRAFT_528474 [Russula dissimulans]|nr:hypothetical protein BC827DRAFT_528474 [Russula dissimulans]
MKTPVTPLQENLEDEKKTFGTRNRHNQLVSAEVRTKPTLATARLRRARSTRKRTPRWISTLKASPDAPPGDKMLLSSFVPTSLLPALQQESKAPAPAVCDVDGCTGTRKYRLVCDWECGAYRMDVSEERLGAVRSGRGLGPRAAVYSLGLG